MTDQAALRDILDRALAMMRQASVSLHDMQSAPFTDADETAAALAVTLSESAEALEIEADELGEPPVEPVLPEVSISAAGDVIEGHPAVFPVTLDKASTAAVTVEWLTFSGTATAGPDYIAAIGIVTFQPGEVYAEVAVATIDNNVDDPDIRQFGVHLRNPVGCTISGEGHAAANILDDDLPEEPGPDDGPLPAGRLALQEPADPFTSPVTFDPGQMRDAALIAMVVVSYRTPTAYQKFAGAPSSQAAGQAALGFGLTDKGAAQGFRCLPFTAVAAPPAFPHGEAVFALYKFGGTGKMRVQINDSVAESNGPATPVLIDGQFSVGAGWWKGVPVDPVNGEVRAFAIYDASADPGEVAAVYRSRPEWIEALAKPVTPPVTPPPVEPPPVTPPPVTPPGDGLEPIDTSAAQIALVTGAALGRYEGFGWGANSWSGHDASAYVTHMKALTTDLGPSARVLRLWTPENDGFTATYKKCADAFRALVPDPIILATGFIWRGKITPEKFADGVARSVSQGIPITHVGLQNEPDGNPDNAIDEKHLGLVDGYRRVRARLDALGLAHIKIIGFEWAHWGTSGGANEFDKLKVAGLVPGTVMASGGHDYSDGLRNAITTQRWWTLGCSPWSTEDGNLGLPNAWGRMAAGWTHGAAVKVIHIGYGSADQALVLAGGTKAPWYGGYQLMLATLPVGTVWRTVTSSDRPSGMTAEFAQHMVRSPGKNPRLQVACGKRPDGSWWLTAVNTTQGGGVSSPYVNACYPAASLQATVRIAELAGQSGQFVARTLGGATKGVALVDGYVRLPTLAPGGLVVAEGGA